jgi:FixJ family two-component response regulator
VRVVEVVVEGLTNPQIAEKMFIARGTVKVHLSPVSPKSEYRAGGTLSDGSTANDVVTTRSHVHPRPEMARRDPSTMVVGLRRD